MEIKLLPIAIQSYFMRKYKVVLTPLMMKNLELIISLDSELYKNKGKK